MQKYLEILGFKVRDKVTGFEGTSESVCFDLYGCVQVCCRPSVDPAKPYQMPDGRWFDFNRLTVIGSGRAMPVPEFALLPGPADKPRQRSSPID
jgi:hypothetical protein